MSGGKCPLCGRVRIVGDRCCDAADLDRMRTRERLAVLPSEINPNLLEVIDMADPQLAPDMVNNPPHYTSHPSGVECIQIVEHMGFCLGNVFKYLWRADQKGSPIEDLEKARFYLDREIARRKGGAA